VPTLVAELVRLVDRDCNKIEAYSLTNGSEVVSGIRGRERHCDALYRVCRICFANQGKVVPPEQTRYFWE